jgi:hypothetical protein
VSAAKHRDLLGGRLPVRRHVLGGLISEYERAA